MSWFGVCMQIDPGQSAGLGSPAAAALMPGGGGGCDGLPAVNRAYNLYAPYDPIAYRSESNCTEKESAKKRQGRERQQIVALRHHHLQASW